LKAEHLGGALAAVGLAIFVVSASGLMYSSVQFLTGLPSTWANPTKASVDTASQQVGAALQFAQFIPVGLGLMLGGGAILVFYPERIAGGTRPLKR